MMGAEEEFSSYSYKLKMRLLEEGIDHGDEGDEGLFPFSPGESADCANLEILSHTAERLQAADKKIKELEKLIGERDAEIRILHKKLAASRKREQVAVGKNRAYMQLHQKDTREVGIQVVLNIASASPPRALRSTSKLPQPTPPVEADEPVTPLVDNQVSRLSVVSPPRRARPRAPQEQPFVEFDPRFPLLRPSFQEVTPPPEEGDKDKPPFLGYRWRHFTENPFLTSTSRFLLNDDEDEEEEFVDIEIQEMHKNETRKSTGKKQTKEKRSAPRRRVLLPELTDSTQLKSLPGTSRTGETEDSSSINPISYSHEEVEVPKWRYIDTDTELPQETKESGGEEALEDISPTAILKKHARLEQDEKRRKRWDSQRLRREMEAEEKKRKAEERERQRMKKARVRKTTRVSKGNINNPDSDSSTKEDEEEGEDELFLRITDDPKVILFGQLTPDVEDDGFILAWIPPAYYTQASAEHAATVAAAAITAATNTAAAAAADNNDDDNDNDNNGGEGATVEDVTIDDDADSDDNGGTATLPPAPPPPEEAEGGNSPEEEEDEDSYMFEDGLLDNYNNDEYEYNDNADADATMSTAPIVADIDNVYEFSEDA